MATFTLPDPYEGWSVERLKDRCRELGGALMEWELIAANMGSVPAALDQLTTQSREKVENMMRAYSD